MPFNFRLFVRHTKYLFGQVPLIVAKHGMRLTHIVSLALERKLWSVEVRLAGDRGQFSWERAPRSAIIVLLALRNHGHDPCRRL